MIKNSETIRVGGWFTYNRWGDDTETEWQVADFRCDHISTIMMWSNELGGHCLHIEVGNESCTIEFSTKEDLMKYGTEIRSCIKNKRAMAEITLIWDEETQTKKVTETFKWPQDDSHLDNEETKTKKVMETNV